MSHVDEGLIHAWIDGAFPPGNEQGEEIEAHVALCVDCRVRLEKARELKERAQIVMHRLAPDAIVTPPFDEVLARRERQRAVTNEPAVFGPAAAEPQSAARPPKRRRTDVFPIPFAWAATLILAVGAGWMGRELMLGREAADAGPGAAAIQSEATMPDRGAVAPLEANEPEAGAPAPLAPNAAVADARARAERADAGVDQGGQQQPSDAQRVSGFAPTAALKANDSMAQRLAGARRDSTAIMLPGLNAAAAPPPIAREALAARVATVSIADSASPPPEVGRLLAAYVRALAEERWTPEPLAIAGLIGYEPVASIEGLEPLRSERAAVDSVELLRIVYEIGDDTVEVVQPLVQMQVALEGIVVTGGRSGDSAARADTSAAARQERNRALPPRAPLRDAGVAAETERVSEVLDSATVLESMNVVMLRGPERTVLLLGRIPSTALQVLAERIR